MIGFYERTLTFVLALLFAGYGPATLACGAQCARQEIRMESAGQTNLPCHEDDAANTSSGPASTDHAPATHKMPCCMTLTCGKCVNSMVPGVGPSFMVRHHALTIAFAAMEAPLPSHPAYPLDHPPKTVA